MGLVVLGVLAYSIRPPPTAPEQGDYREMRPTDDNSQGVVGAVAYHTQRHNTANHTAESSTNDHVIKVVDGGGSHHAPGDQNGTPAIPLATVNSQSTATTTAPPTKKLSNSNAVPHTEYTRLSIVQDDERLS